MHNIHSKSSLACYVKLYQTTRLSKFGIVLMDYIRDCAECLWLKMKKPTVKIHRDKIRFIIRNRPSAVVADNDASGIFDDVSTMHQLLH